MADNSNQNGIGGSALFNLLQGANKQNFNASKYAVKSSSFTTSITDLQTGNTPAQNAAVNGIQYDIFERANIGNPPNSTGIEDSAYATDRVVGRRTSVDNRVLINYKNYVFTSIDGNQSYVNGVGEKTTETGVFLNKIKPNTKFTGNNFKDPSIETIVENMNSYPSTKISYADFVYCKKLGTAPNNRLVILRRFFQPVDDNLFDSPYANTSQQPMSVMVTWFDEFPFQIKYGEDWTRHTAGILEEFANTISSLSPSFGGKTGRATTLIKEIGRTASSEGGSNISSPWLKSLWYQFINGLYKNSSNQIPPNFKNVLTEANPNLIRQSVIKQGLSFSIRIDLEFTYVMRYANGIDPHIAMHNIIANAIRMGTSTSVTIFPKSTEFAPDFITQLNEGHVIGALKLVYENVSNYLNNLFNDAKETVKKNTSVDDIKNTVSGTSLNDVFNSIDKSSFSRQLFSLFRFRLTAAVQADLGTPSGSWHVTVGNPFNPIASVGDLVIASSGGMNMKFNKELSYDDQPTEVTFSIQLENARPRGAQEIEQIFNAGRGRIYVYPQYDDDPDLYLSDNNPYMGAQSKDNSKDNNNYIDPNQPWLGTKG